MSEGVLRNIGTLAVCRKQHAEDFSECRNAALAWRDGRIAWFGADADLPAEFHAVPATDADAGLVTPGLIDCHTHMGFGGWRSDEFALRCAGKSYLEIARSGGGIQSTVAATRATDRDTLLQRCSQFAAEMLQLGVTSFEAKSGYGLSVEAECKQLQVYRALADGIPQTVVVTFLGAHTIPPEYRCRRAEYVALLRDQLIPQIAGEGLARFCDIFVEETAFSIAEARQILAAARDHGLGIKVHADQLTSSGGAELAAEFEAISAEHLEFCSDRGLIAMSKAGVVAVSLPLASLYLGDTYLDARRCLQAGVDVAVASDFNPGSAPSFHLPLALTLACLKQGMTPTQALHGATINAAKALDLEQEIGSIEVGKRADLARFDAPNVNHWLYHFRANACQGVVINGNPVTPENR